MTLAPTVVDVHGSLRRGRATLLGGYQLSWESGAKLLWLPHLATEFVLEGDDTRVTGRINTGLSGLALVDAKGRAGPNLAGVIPGAWDCNMSARINDVSFRWGWRKASAAGDITTPLGSCTKNGRAQNIPALTLSLVSVGPDALVTLTSDTTLATVLVKRTRRADIAILPASADIFPQVPRGGPINLQLPF